MDNNVNMTGLQEFYREDEVARVAIDHFAGRERNFRETTIESLRAIVARERTVTRGDIVRFFNRMEALGCGQFVIDKLADKSRFVWRFENIALAKAAQSGPGSPPALRALGAAGEASVNGSTVEHQFRLRPEVVVRVSLPNDLRAAEADRFAAFVKTLPIND